MNYKNIETVKRLDFDHLDMLEASGIEPKEPQEPPEPAEA